jgi:two-component system, chemotaxis family, response regulator Rcp1
MQRPIEILLVEDSPGDIWLTREALMQGPVPKNISVVNNGEQALDFVRKRGQFASAARPDLVLLDLNLPRRDGLEVLREIKSDAELSAITVIVLTTSEAPPDVNSAYDLNANCYVVKPVDLEEFTVTIRGIEDFWMNVASLPTTPPHGTGESSQGGAATSGASQGSNGSPSGRRREGNRAIQRRRPAQKRALMRGTVRRQLRAGLS